MMYGVRFHDLSRVPALVALRLISTQCESWAGVGGGDGSIINAMGGEASLIMISLALAYV